MESLLHSTIPAHQETLQAQDRKPQPAKSPEPLPIEKELDNLVINETGAQKYIDFFDFFNASFPLVDRQTFWEFFERQYSGEASSKRSWFALLNVALSIGSITATETVSTNVRICDPLCSTNMTEMASKFLQNACSVLFNVLFLEMDLMSVQAMVGMAFVMQAIFNPEGAFTLIGAAARLATTLGLHQWLGGFGLSKSELQQRQRVFWVLYVLEKDLATRIGRPSAIDDDDIDLETALNRVENDPAITVSFTGEHNHKFYAFKSMCSLAVIQSKVHRCLYRVSSRSRTAEERLDSIGQLDAELQVWKDRFPIEIRPEHPIQCALETRFPIILLHCGYYHCLSTIHRANAHHELWTSRAAAAANDDAETAESETLRSSSSKKSSWLNPRTQSSYVLCLAAARSVIHLSIESLHTYSDPRNSLIWVAPYFPISASLLLFTHIVQYPLDARAEADLALMELLSKAAITDVASVLTFISDVIGELLNIAQTHVQNARAGSSVPPAEQIDPGQHKPDDLSNQRPSSVRISATVTHPTTPFQESSQSYYTIGEADLTSVSHNMFEPQNLDEAFSNPPDFAIPSFSVDVTPDSDQASWQNPMVDDPFYLLQYGDWD